MFNSTPGMFFPDTQGLVIGVGDYGATGNGTTDDTAAIQGALNAANANGGGTVYAPQGTYLISSPLIIYSNTTLWLTKTTTVSLAPNSNCNMLIDSAHYSGNGSVSNITVWGGIWQRNSNGGSGTATNTILLGGNNICVQGCTITSSGGKYSILLQNITNFLIDDIYLNEIESDGIHLQGPASFGKISNILVNGRPGTGDDVISITPNDWTQFAVGSGGDITDLVIDTVLVSNLYRASVVKVLGGTNGATVFNTKRIKIRNLSGNFYDTGNPVSVVVIGDDSGQANTSGGQIDDISVDGVSVNYVSGTTSKNLFQICNTLAITTIKFTNITVLSDCSAFLTLQGPVNNLLISNVTGATASAAMGAFIWLTTAAASVGRLFLSKIDITYAGSRGGNVIRATVVGNILTEVYLSEVYFNNTFRLAQIVAATTFYMSHVHLVGNSEVFNVSGTASVVVASASGVIFAANGNNLTSPGTLESKDVNFPMDITNAQVAKNNGDACTTTATAGSINTGSPVVYDTTNSHWYKIANQTTY
jgi:pectate lyase-like protein